MIVLFRPPSPYKIEAQRSGFDFERRSNEAIRSFRQIPQVTDGNGASAVCSDESGVCSDESAVCSDALRICSVDIHAVYDILTVHSKIFIVYVQLLHGG